MTSSYTVMLTAFYVDNGKNLPLADRLPQAAYWLLPAIVAALLIIRRQAAAPVKAESRPTQD